MKHLWVFTKLNFLQIYYFRKICFFRLFSNRISNKCLNVVEYGQTQTQANSEFKNY